MKKRLISFLLLIATLVGMLPTMVFAAPTEEETLGEIDIFNGEYRLAYLSMNGIVREQVYTYYNYQPPQGGAPRKIPAYCVNPNQYGVPQNVGPGQSIKYIAKEKNQDPKVTGIIANGYPNRSYQEMGLENEYQAYYSTKMALWCYLLASWDINKLKVNPNLSGDELVRANKMLTAAVDIYRRGTMWTENLSPNLTCTPDRSKAYEVMVDGKSYKQQVFTFWSKTWIGNMEADVAFTDPDSVPQGTRIVDMNNQDITKIKTTDVGDGYAGQFKVLYPLESVQGKSGTVQLSFDTTAYVYAIFYATCAQTDQYGNIQNYMVDTDPVRPMQLSANSTYGDDPNVKLDTGLKIVKYEAGTTIPLEGAMFEVIDPNGETVGTFATDSNGEINLPLSVIGNYTVIEREAPAHYLMSKSPTQNVKVVYGEVAELTFENEPYGNLRVEKTSNTGMNLPGAKIKIEHIKSGKTYTTETNVAGVACFEKIQPGAYRVQEVSAPAGWELNDTVYTVDVLPGETAKVPIINNELPGLRILKYDRKSHEAMPHVTFEIWRDEVSIGTYETNAFGEILLTDIPAGTYRAVEVNTGDEAHILVTTSQSIELKAGDGIRKLTFFNDKKPGMKLVKVDSNDVTKALPNAIFEIKSVAGDYGPKEFTTDEHGEVDVSHLPTGAYVVKEVKAPEGYLIDNSTRIIQLNPNETAEFVFTNTIKPSLRIIKYSSDGSRLKGVTFHIKYVEDGTHYLDRTTNEQGEIFIENLEPGVLSIRETATTSNHILDLREYHVQLFPGITSEIEIENQKRPNLYVHKHDADTDEPVPGTIFLVKAADGHSVDEIRTDSTGTAKLENLLPGVYEIIEKSVPAPYLKDAPSQLITLWPNRDRDVYFENHKKPGLIVKKICSVTKDPLEHVKFQVTYASNHTSSGEINNLGTFYTDGSGEFRLDGLKDGWYKITELESVPGYAIKEPETQEVYIKGGESKKLIFENTPLSAISVFKYDSVTGEAVKGAKFQVKYLTGVSGTGGTVIGTYITSNNGSFTVTGLKEGTYIVEEIASDSGHVIDTAPQTVYISGKAQDVVSLYFGNAPKGGIAVTKIDSVTREPLSDVEFIVTEADGSYVGPANGRYKTDARGTFVIKGIAPGTTLVVRETKTRDGYILDNVAQTVTIKAGVVTPLEFQNAPKGSVMINKLDSVTHKPLKGAQFKITYSDGSFVDDANGSISSNGIYTTDENGQIILSGITGTIVVTETRSIPGYAIDPASRTQTVKINPNDLQKLTFYNIPQGCLVITKRDSVTKEPLSGVDFQISGCGDCGYPAATYTTDSDGKITLKHIPEGCYSVVEVKAKDGYLLDDTLNVVHVKPGECKKVTFDNMPLGGLLIKKMDAVTRHPLADVIFKVTTTDGTVVGTSNGEFRTDENGFISIPDLKPGAYVVQETQAKPGYLLDDTPKHIEIKDHKTYSMEVFNKALGGLVIIKSDEETGERISAVQFEVRKMNGEVVGTYTTDRNGMIQLPGLKDGWYTVTELKAAKGYKLDATPQQVEVKDGATSTLELTNHKTSHILIHKIDADTGEGIYGAVFILYDRHHNPIGQYVTDQEGYIYMDEGLEDGRYYLREILPADGYAADNVEKTVYVRYGSTEEIIWKNKAIKGQIQIVKKSADDSPINGLPAGTLLEGAVFEIYDKAGNRVDTIRTDRNGRAASKPLPLSRYTVREVSAPSYYAINPTVLTAYLEHEGQIVTFEVEDNSVGTGVSIKKTGPVQVMSGQPVKYTITGVRNTSTVPLGYFYWRDALPGQVNVTRLVTGTYNQPLAYKIVYKTNVSGGTYRTLADNLSTTQNYVIDARAAALGLAANEKITEIMYVFGQVKAGFAQVETPYVYGTVAGGLSNGSSITNVADVGGVYQGQWIMAVSRWLSSVYAKSYVSLPKTGY